MSSLHLDAVAINGGGPSGVRLDPPATVAGDLFGVAGHPEREVAAVGALLDAVAGHADKFVDWLGDAPPDVLAMSWAAEARHDLDELPHVLRAWAERVTCELTAGVRESAARRLAAAEARYDLAHLDADPAARLEDYVALVQMAVGRCDRFCKDYGWQQKTPSQDGSRGWAANLAPDVRAAAWLLRTSSCMLRCGSGRDALASAVARTTAAYAGWDEVGGPIAWPATPPAVVPSSPDADPLAGTTRAERDVAFLGELLDSVAGHAVDFRDWLADQPKGTLSPTLTSLVSTEVGEMPYAVELLAGYLRNDSYHSPSRAARERLPDPDATAGPLARLADVLAEMEFASRQCDRFTRRYEDAGDGTEHGTRAWAGSHVADVKAAAWALTVAGDGVCSGGVPPREMEAAWGRVEKRFRSWDDARRGRTRSQANAVEG